jgi:hypothetical protein
MEGRNQLARSALGGELGAHFAGDGTDICDATLNLDPRGLQVKQ